MRAPPISRWTTDPDTIREAAEDDLTGQIMLDRPLNLSGLGVRKRRHFKPHFDRDGNVYLRSRGTRIPVKAVRFIDWTPGMAPMAEFTIHDPDPELVEDTGGRPR